MSGLLLSAAAPSMAQSTSFEWGLLEGRVVTISREPVNGAVVRLEGPQPRSAASDASGRFAFPALEPGEHALEVGKAGYVTSLVERIELLPGEVLVIEFELAPGKETSLTVTSMPVIDHTTASGSWRLDRRQLRLLPGAARLGGLLALRPQPSKLALLDGAESGAWVERAGSEALWHGLPTEFVAALAVAATDPSAAQDFAGLAPVRLLTRPSPRSWHAGVSSHWSGSGLAATARPKEAATEEGATQGAVESRWLRPVASGGGPVFSRTRAWSGAASFRQRGDGGERGDRGEGGEARTGPSSQSSDDDYLQLRLDGQPSARWRWSLLHLQGRGEREAEVAYLLRQRQTQVQALGLATPHLELSARGLERRSRGGLSSLAVGEAESRAWDLALGWVRGSHRVVAGAAEERWQVAVDGPDSSLAREPRRRALWLADKWRLGRLSLNLGVRLARRDLDFLSSSTPGHTRDRDVVLPRLALSWDPLGGGQWALFASAGRYDATAASVVAVPTAADQVERLGAGVRHQLLPGVVVEAEVAEREVSGGGDLLLRVPAPGVRRLAYCAGSELTGRFSAWARLGRRWDLAADYELARARDLRRCQLALTLPLAAAPGSLLGGVSSRQDLRMWGTWRFENGVEAGAILRQTQVKVLPPAGPADDPPDSAIAAVDERSFTHVDLALGYGFTVLPALGSEGARMTLRLELLNALDEEAPSSEPAPFTAEGARGGLLHLEPRRLWAAVELRF